MKKISTLIIGGVAIVSVGAAGYWIGSKRTEDLTSDLAGVVGQPSRMASSSITGLRTETAVSKEPVRKILYYRNPMGLTDTSPVPKKDGMGMDYVPVFEGEESGSDGKQIVIGIEKVQKLGVKSEAATLRMLDRTIRAVGKIEINERHNYTIAPKFEGWVERLYVNTSGQPVSKGQPLFEVYSPELISALREYSLATQGALSLKDAGEEAQRSMSQLAAASLARLKNWGVADEQIREFTNAPLTSDRDKRNLTFYAPISGIVLEKKAVQGMRFMPGEVLYQIADLSSVWVMAEVAEQDIGLVKAGSVAQVNIAAYPDKHFAGKVDFIYPTLDTATRTVQVRVELANPNGLLKPAMFANVELAVSQGGKVLAVPVSAVIDSGTRKVVLVQLAEGHFEPRTVKLGGRSENYVEVLEGIAEGEQVVTSALFLIDAESNLKAALSGMGGQEEHDGSTPPAESSQSRHEGH